MSAGSAYPLSTSREICSSLARRWERREDQSVLPARCAGLKEVGLGTSVSMTGTDGNVYYIVCMSNNAEVHQSGEVTRLRRVLCRELTEFLEIGRLENLTTAAASLDVLQPTLSRSLARLQRRLGVVLVTRTGRSIRLTKQERTLLALAERTVAVLEAGLADLVSDDDPVVGLVRFSFLRSFRARAVPDLLRAFRSEHPAVRFALGQGSTDTIIHGILDDHCDVALVSPPLDDPRLAHEHFVDEPIQLVVPAGHRLAGTSTVQLAEVATETFISLQRGFGTRACTDVLCRRAGFTPRIGQETEDVTLACGLVDAGFGVSLLPRLDQETHRNVVALTVDDPEAYRQIAVTLVGRAAALVACIQVSRPSRRSRTRRAQPASSSWPNSSTASMCLW